MAASHPQRVAGLVYIEAEYPYAFEVPSGPTMQEFLQVNGPQPPKPGGSDLASFRSLQHWDAKMYGFKLPQAEFRQSWESDSDGRPVKERESPGSQLLAAIMTAPARHADFRVPALVLFAIPHVPEGWMKASTNPDVRKAADAYFRNVDALAERQAAAVQDAVHGARCIRFRGMHYLFLSNEADVLREIGAFLAGLKY
jgi:pimeloyl-ACP methyl ester carboxylesterase